MTPNGPGPILVSEILAYADLTLIRDAESRNMLLKGIQSMDRLWLENHYKEDVTEGQEEDNASS